MRQLKMAFHNVLLHRVSSLVLLTVFAVSSFVLFWSFGYGNNIAQLVQDLNRDSYGDIAFLTEYFEMDRLELLKQLPGVEKVVFERELKVMLDNPDKSSLVTLLEITGENRDRLARYIRPVEGRLPEKEDELVVTDFIQKGLYQVGDTVYATTSTPDKVLNALQYRVVGISKSTAFKAIGYGYLISEKSMDMLVNSDKHANLVYLFLHEGARSEESIKRMFEQVEKILKDRQVTINDSWTILEREEQLSVFSLVFGGMKPLMLIIIFPLIGAVIAAIVWIYSFKRRREIWTYVSLGMKDKQVILILAMEYWIIAILGLATGLAAGAMSGEASEAANLWLQFSYTFSSPVGTIFGLADMAVIVGFTLFSVLLWMWIPVRKIIRSVPFSY